MLCVHFFSAARELHFLYKCNTKFKIYIRCISSFWLSLIILHFFKDLFCCLFAFVVCVSALIHITVHQTKFNLILLIATLHVYLQASLIDDNTLGDLGSGQPMRLQINVPGPLGENVWANWNSCYCNAWWSWVPITFHLTFCDICYICQMILWSALSNNVFVSYFYYCCIFCSYILLN